MKRVQIFALLMLFLAVFSVGCTEDIKPVQDETESVSSEEEKGFAERIVGKYYACLSEDADEPDRYLDIYFINSFLIAEVSETYAAYFAMELTPADEADLYSTVSDSIDVIALFFSGFSNFGEYWEESEIYTLHLTEYGVDFISADGNTVSYIRDDTMEAQHDPEKYREYLTENGYAEYAGSVIGQWCGKTADGTDIYLELYEDGGMRILNKRAGEPVRVHIGLAVTDMENKLLTSVSERVGWGEMPYLDTVEFTLDDDYIKLCTLDDCSILPSDTEILLEKLPSTGKKG